MNLSEIIIHSYEKAIKFLENGILKNECYISNKVVNEVVTVVDNKSERKIAKKIDN